MHLYISTPCMAKLGIPSQAHTSAHKRIHPRDKPGAGAPPNDRLLTLLTECWHLELSSEAGPGHSWVVGADIESIFRSGGKGLVDLLEYCARSVQMEPIFVFLVGEYRVAPTATKALALYDVFCAPQALGRISAPEVLPPLDLRILGAMAPLQRWLAQSSARGPDSAAGLSPPLPARFHFDFIVAHLQADPTGSLKRICQSYDPSRTPWANLPGGNMTPGQRAFIEKVWEPVLRPRLVEAGFRRIANIA